MAKQEYPVDNRVSTLTLFAGGTFMSRHPGLVVPQSDDDLARIQRCINSDG